ncbi:MAG: peptidoglycan-binding domain-containing protein [Pseudomonadota bacterium]
MTPARRTLITLAASLMAGSLQAQTGFFVPPSESQQQASRTAELLAATQQHSSFTPTTSFTPTSSKAVARMDERLLVTRQSQSSGPVLAMAETVPPPAPAYAASNYASTSYASAVPAPSAAYGNSYNVAGSATAIPAMPDARPGECFALVKVPEQFRSYQKEYELRAASERIETIPPRYETVTEQYVAQEAFERLEVVPASFRMVTEQVEVAAPSSRFVSTEPVYETVTEQVLEQPARTVWKRGNGPIQRIDNATGEIMCLVEEPAIYKTVSRRVLKAPAEVREVPVPGQLGSVSRRVLERPAEVRRVIVPEQVASRTVRRLAEPGGVRRIPIPSQMATTNVRELVSPARLEWRSVLCETNMTPENISRVQAALQREGFDPGPANGRLSGQTIAALNQYQRARSLPEDRYLNMDTVRALGVM